ncbi:ribosome recycling factor [bacterium]|nr:ribosome recycling factor [bacterium]
MPYKAQIKELQVSMQKALDHLSYQFKEIRTGKASPGIVEDIKVDYYGVATPIKSLANLTVPDPRTIKIEPFDVNCVQPICRAIQASPVGITPVDDGRVIRLPMPELTEERRRDLTKLTKKYSEDTKVNIRNLRRDCIEKIKKMEKDKILTEDQRKQGEKSVQTETDNFIKKVDELVKVKDNEIMTL